MTKTLLYPYSEGKQDLLCDEQNDCSVRALANATGMTYEKSHFLMERKGRKNKQGFDILKIIEVYLSCGFNLEVFGTTQVAKYIRFKGKTPMSTKFHDKSQTLKTMLESGKYNKGSFIFGTINHVFCVKDGKILDNGGNYTTDRIYEVFTFCGN